MQINRFFKSTLGIGSEAFIANTLDNSGGGAVVAARAATATVTVTLAGTPTLGDQLVITVGSVQYPYTVKSSDTTAAILHTSILTLLQANTQGFTAAATGTTSSVYTLTGPTNTSFNGVQVNATSTIGVGPTFSAISVVNFNGGANASGGGAQPDYKSFCANAAAGSMAVFFADHNFNGNGLDSPAAPIGSTSLAVNQTRDIFYGYKMADGSVKKTSHFPVSGIKYTSVAYTAGQPDIFTVDLTLGTITAGQQVNIRITNETVEAIPYPNYFYYVTSTGTPATDATALAAQINAEKVDPVATATVAGNIVTITSNSNVQVLRVQSFIFTTSTAPNDASNIVVTHTQTAIAPIGTPADIAEFETYFQVIIGEPLYTNGGVLPSEFGLPVSNISGSVQYGYLVVTAQKEEFGVVHNFKNKKYCVVGVASSLLATLVQY
jgi:hypothetical protein